MKIFTQIGFLDINPEAVVSIKPNLAISGKGSFKDLSYRVEFKDELSIGGHHAVSVSKADAIRLSVLSGIKIQGNEAKGMEIQKCFDSDKIGILNSFLRLHNIGGKR